MNINIKIHRDKIDNADDDCNDDNDDGGDDDDGGGGQLKYTTPPAWNCRMFPCSGWIKGETSA